MTASLLAVLLLCLAVFFVFNPTTVLLFECFVLPKAAIKLYLPPPKKLFNKISRCHRTRISYYKTATFNFSPAPIFLSHWQIHADGPNGRPQVPQSLLLVMAGLPSAVNVLTNQGQLVSFSWRMKTENYSEETIERYTRDLETLLKRGAILEKQQSVKETIARQNWSNGTKQTVTNAVKLYWKHNGIEAKLPEYKPEAKIPFIPTEAELDQPISGCKHRLATFLQVLKETAARYGEAYQLKWTDYNTENGTLSITPEKGSAPRCPKIGTKLQTMLSTIPRTSNRIFDYKNKDVIRKSYQRARKRIATNLGNPRIQQIHFHTFRHWKATQEFHKTNNVILVMKLLGHKCLNNTQRYIQLLPDLSDDYVCDIAKTLQEAMKLVENGYEYVTEMDGAKLFRKRK